MAGALAGLVPGCQADDLTARAVWLRDTLVLDNQLFLETAPEHAAGKFATMGEDSYRFFRGTAPQYARDFSEPGAPGEFGSAFRTPQTRDVALIGDPHPENVGTYGGGDAQRVDFNDYDAARFGPFDFDVRRLALGVFMAHSRVAARAAFDLDPGAAVESMVRAYVAEIRRLATQSPTGAEPAAEPTVGRILQERLDDAAAGALAAGRLGEYTRVRGNERTMVAGDLQPPRQLQYGPFTVQVFENSVRRVDAATQRLVAAAIAAYAADGGESPRLGSPLAIKGISQRLGAGVSSYPNARFYVLLQGPTMGPDDDVLLEVKQVLDPLRLTGFSQYPDPAFATNAQRVVAMQRALQGERGLDPLLGASVVPPYGFRVRQRSDEQTGVSVDRIADRIAQGEWTGEDFTAFASEVGTLLARAHGRAAKRDGVPGARAIAAAVGPTGDAFVREIADSVEAYGPVIEEDYALFVALLARYGPTLGYRQP